MSSSAPDLSATAIFHAPQKPYFFTGNQLTVPKSKLNEIFEIKKTDGFLENDQPLPRSTITFMDGKKFRVRGRPDDVMMDIINGTPLIAKIPTSEQIYGCLQEEISERVKNVNYSHMNDDKAPVPVFERTEGTHKILRIRKLTDQTTLVELDDYRNYMVGYDMSNMFTCAAIGMAPEGMPYPLINLIDGLKQEETLARAADIQDIIANAPAFKHA